MSTTGQDQEAEKTPMLRRTQICDAVIIAAITALLYLRCLANGFVNWDDPAFIINNPQIKALTWQNLKAIWQGGSSNLPYYPAVFTTYLLEHSIWGLNPLGFHATSVALHSINTALAYLLVARLFKNRVAAVITGLLMGLHPLHVDAVAWASGRRDVLSAFFVFLSIHAYVSYLNKRSIGNYVASLALYLLAMFAKPMAALLPLMLLIVDYQQRRRDRRLEILEKVPYLVIAVLLAYATITRQVTAEASSEHATMSFYGAQHAWAAIGFYLMKLTAPLKLTLIYGNTQPHWWMTLAVTLSIAFVTTTIWMLMLSRDYGFGLAWFVLLSAPILGFIPYGYVVRVAPFANHFMYVADIGLFVCVGLIAESMLRNLKGNSKNALLGLIAVCMFLFGAKTFLRCGIWNNSETLWQDAVKYNRSPNATIAHANLAKALKESGNYEEALKQARRAVEVYPGNINAQTLARELEKKVR